MTWWFRLATALGLRGDVKYSTWFLTVENARLEGLDFFITRLYDETGAGWLRVVLLTPIAQELIGETKIRLNLRVESAPAWVPRRRVSATNVT